MTLDPSSKTPSPPRAGSPRSTAPYLRDFFDSVLGRAEAALDLLTASRVSYETVPWIEARKKLEAAPGASDGAFTDEILAEDALEEIEVRTRRLLEDIECEDPFLRRWAADSILARCCYLLCRLLKPERVVETGVAYGVSSAFILTALRENGRGALHSVDLPPLTPGATRFQGIAVPDDLRDRWTLHRGSSRRKLPGVLREPGGVDLFLHDSLHTAANMTFEFDLALRHLNSGGVILADDIERNDAFRELTRNTGGLSTVVADRETDPLHGQRAPSVFGILIPEPPARPKRG